MLGEGFDLDEIQLDGIVGLLLTGVGQHRGGFLVAVGGIQQLALQQLRRSELVAWANLRQCGQCLAFRPMA